MGKRDYYEDLTNRNIGLVTEEQQAKLKNSCVAIFGLGGLGGTAAEALCRMGIGHMKMIDHSVFEPTNLNRQIFCFRSTIGQKKREVTKRFLADINPDIKIDMYELENSANIKDILKGVDAIVLATDTVKACIIVSRAAREMDIPLVESWAVLYLNVRVFTKDTVTLEEAYNLNTAGKKTEEFSKNELKEMDVKMLDKFLYEIEGLKSYRTELLNKRIAQRENPTLGPFVFLNAVFMAVETVKVLLGWGDISYAPRFAAYDPILHNIPKQIKT